MDDHKRQTAQLCLAFIAGIFFGCLLADNVAYCRALRDVSKDGFTFTVKVWNRNHPDAPLLDKATAN